MLKILSVAALVAITGVALAQTTPSITPSDTPAVTPSQTPSITPSQPPSVAVGGLSRCENLLGDEKEKCQKEERAAGGSSVGPHAPYSTGAGSGAGAAPQGTMPSTPSGSVR